MKYKQNKGGLAPLFMCNFNVQFLTNAQVSFNKNFTLAYRLKVINNAYCCNIRVNIFFVVPNIVYRSIVMVPA